MTQTYAAFYLPPITNAEPKPDQKMVDKIKAQLTSGWNNIKKTVNLDLPEASILEMARNINLQGTTELVQRYATAAITDIMSGKAITSRVMMDSLFNTYAPALNAGLVQCGYNSFMEFQRAAETGAVNIANFIQGVSHGLSTIQKIGKNERPARVGEEIPIDVVENIKYTYSVTAAHKRLAEVRLKTKYVSDLDPVVITLNAHVKNENAELWNINDFNNKIVTIMAKKEPVFFRVGKSIYEECLITKYEPTISNIYDIKFEADIEYREHLATPAKRRNNYRYLNKPNYYPILPDITTLCAETTYGGIITGKRIYT